MASKLYYISTTYMTRMNQFINEEWEWHIKVPRRGEGGRNISKAKREGTSPLVSMR
jgi:hypothetical protein